MLSDILTADGQLASGLGPGHARLKSDLGAAARFELADTFAAAADQVLRSSAAAAAKVMPLCRLPARTCWFETVFAARSAFVGGTDLGEMFRTDVHRIGILLKAGDAGGLVWDASLGWSFRNGESSLSNYAMRLDLRPEPLEAGGVPVSAFLEMGHRPAEAAALAEIENRATFGPSPYHAEMEARLPPDPALRVALARMGQGDWNAEPLFWICAVALLNSRNVAETVPGPDLSKLSKARARKGAAPLLDYSVCRIAPRLGSRSPTGAEVGRDGVRAHFVRGHFKARASGIHWWSPHARGDAALGTKDKRYEVT